MELVTKRRFCRDLRLFWRICANIGYSVLGFGMCIYMPLVIRCVHPVIFGGQRGTLYFLAVVVLFLIPGSFIGVRFGIRPLGHDFRTLYAVWAGHLYVAKLVVADKSDSRVSRKRLWIGTDGDLFCGPLDVTDGQYQQLQVGEYCYYIANRSDIRHDHWIYPVEQYELAHNLSAKIGCTVI